MFPWLKFANLLLQVYNTTMKYVNDNQLMDAGEARGMAKSLAQATKTANLVDVVVLELQDATEAEIDAILATQYRD
jgi:DNA-directed RNA polymerase subunit F